MRLKESSKDGGTYTVSRTTDIYVNVTKQRVQLTFQNSVKALRVKLESTYEVKIKFCR